MTETAFVATLKTDRRAAQLTLNTDASRDVTYQCPFVEFVANLYSQPAHLIVRRDLDIKSPADLQGKRVHVGLKNSGDYAMSLALLKFFNLEEDIKVVSDLPYTEIVQEFENDTLDAAFITLGVDAPVFVKLAKTDKCDVIEIPNGQALAKRYLFTYQSTIPRGLYSYLPREMPETKVETVASGAQLLTHENANAYLVEAVTRIVLDKNFALQNRLNELYEDEGHAFALKKTRISHPRWCSERLRS